MTKSEAKLIIVDVLTEFGIKTSMAVKNEIADTVLGEFEDLEAVSFDPDEVDDESIDPDSLSDEDVLSEL